MHATKQKASASHLHFTYEGMQQNLYGFCTVYNGAAREFTVMLRERRNKILCDTAVNRVVCSTARLVAGIQAGLHHCMTL